MSFKPPDSDVNERRKRLKPPPNYKSRSTQLQLFVLVGALMGVLVLMNEARKPQTWAWMWGKGENKRQIDAEVDTRVPEPTSSSESLPSVVASDADKPLDDKSIEEIARSEENLMRKFGWQRIYESLSADQKQTMARLLRSVRLDRQPSPEDLGKWRIVVDKLDSEWTRFVDEQSDVLSAAENPRSAPKRDEAQQQLDRFQQRWSEVERPAFNAVLDQRSLTKEEKDSLASIQRYLDEFDLAAVRDDTVWRPQEREAWFRLLEELHRADEPELKKRSTGEVNFIQIFRQAPEYRGKLVTVRGSVRLGYRVAAPPNDLGIRGYYLFWLRPADGTNVPIVIYSLESPEGFPELTDKQQTQLREEVEVTGYFFKRWVYRAQDGLNSVPLIVAKIPRILPKPPQPKSDLELLSEQFGNRLWIAVVVVIGLLATLAALFAWLVSRSTRSEFARTTFTEGEGPVALDELSIGPSVEESLRQLENKDAQ